MDNKAEIKNQKLDEFYYAVEEALDARTSIAEGLEGVEFLNLDPKTDDPYLQLLYAKHGLFGSYNFKQTYDLLEQIRFRTVNYEPCKTMKIPIEAFIYNQLSLFHLGYQHVIDRNMQLSDEYLQKSIEFGHRNAMVSAAEEILQTIKLSEDNVLKAIQLINRAIELGHCGCSDILIECYKIIGKYKELLCEYDKIINDSGIESYFNPCKCDFIEIVRNINKNIVSGDDQRLEDLKLQFISLLIIGSPSKHRHQIISEFKDIITGDILDEIINTASDKVLKNIIGNLLFIFNINEILYIKYMTKLLKR